MCLGRFFHKWTKWKLVGIKKYHVWDGDHCDYQCDVLERQCEVCGWIVRKEGFQSLV